MNVGWTLLSLQLLANVVKREYVLLQDIVDLLIEWSHEELFPTYTVKDLLWGYDEPLINKTLSLLESLLHKKFPVSDKFGLFVGVSHFKWFFSSKDKTPWHFYTSILNDQGKYPVSILRKSNLNFKLYLMWWMVYPKTVQLC